MTSISEIDFRRARLRVRLRQETLRVEPWGPDGSGSAAPRPRILDGLPGALLEEAPAPCEAKVEVTSSRHGWSTGASPPG